MKLVPLRDKVVVKVAAAETQTSAGLYIPDSAKEKPNKGEVVAVGKEVDEVKVGDVVYYPAYGASNITEDNTDYVVLREKEVVVVVKN